MRESHILLAVFAMFAILSMPLFFTPVFCDFWVFQYVGAHMSPEKLPYLHLPDSKGIFTYVFYGAIDRLFGANLWAYKAAFWLVASISGLALYLVAKKHLGKSSALVALCSFLVFIRMHDLDMIGATESIGVAAALSALAILHYSDSRKLNALAGFLASAAALTNVVFLPSFLIFALMWKFAGLKLRKEFWLACLAPIVAFALFLYATGSLGAFIEWFFGYNLFNNRAIYQSTNPLVFPLAFIVNLPLLASIALLIAIMHFRQFEKSRLFVLCLLPLVLFSFTKFFIGTMLDHYAITALPIISACLGLVFSGFNGFDGLVIKGMIISMLALSLVFPLALEIGYLDRFPLSYDDAYVSALRASMPEMLNSGRLLAAGSRIFSAKAYFAANATYPGKYFFSFGAFQRVEGLPEKIDGDIMGNIGNGSVEFIVADWDCPPMSCPTPTVASAISEHFTCKIEDFGLGEPYNFTYCRRRQP